MYSKTLQTPWKHTWSLFLDVYMHRKGFSFNVFSLRQQEGHMAAGNKPEDVIRVFKIYLKFNSACNCWFYLVNCSGCPNMSRSFSGKRRKQNFYMSLAGLAPHSSWSLCNALKHTGGAMEKKRTKKNRNQSQNKNDKSFKQLVSLPLTHHLLSLLVSTRIAFPFEKRSLIHKNLLCTF